MSATGVRTPCRTAPPRQPSITRIGLDNYHDTVHGHEFGGLSRVVMVRKTDQRIFASGKDGEEPKYETITKETYETFRGNRTERKVTSVEKRTPCEYSESVTPRKIESPNKSPNNGKIPGPNSRIINGRLQSPNRRIVSPNGRVGSPAKLIQNGRTPSRNGSLKISNGKNGFSANIPNGKMGLSGNKTGSPTNKTGSPIGRSRLSLSSSTKDLKMKQMDPLQFAADCLAAHNEYRAKHGVPPLKLNRQICKVSQQWADTLSVRGKLSHSQNQTYGETIYGYWTNNPDYVLNGKEPVDSWYKEIENHMFGTEPTTLQSGHFTQVIWKESKELGVAYSRAKDGKFIVVANYLPPGNCIGHFNENVPPVGGFTSKTLAFESKSKPLTGVLRTSTSEYDQKFEEDCLNAHNEYRKQHGVDPMKLNRKMSKECKDWAKHLAQKGQIEHRKNLSTGENIYCCWSSNPSYEITGREPVDSWYGEISCHDFSREPTDLSSGHFTQVVWKASRELGVGIEKNRNGQIFVVASYSPAGNYIGSFRNNVLPKLCGQSTAETLGNNVCASISSLRISEDENFNQEALKQHNEYRKKHGVPDLKLNSEMCKYAQSWADHLAREGKMYHRPDCKYGENIFCMWSSDPSATPTAKDVCKKWYDEIQDFNFGIESRTPKAGHFTQMVWKESSEFGIGLAKGKNNGKSFVVANYNPKGNYIGKYLTNVPKPLTK